MSRRKTGSVAELAVASKLVELGFTVSWPLSSVTYDLIAEKGGKSSRIQVKGASISKHGSYRCSILHGACDNRRNYRKKDCDFIVFYAPYSKDFSEEATDGFYVVPVSVLRPPRAQIILFPAGKGRGNRKTSIWEKYRDGWSSI